MKGLVIYCVGRAEARYVPCAWAGKGRCKVKVGKVKVKWGDERSMTNYIAVDNRLRREVDDTKVVRGLFSDSDHFAVVAKVRVRERWEFKGNGRKEGKEGKKKKIAKRERRRMRRENNGIGLEI